MRVEIRGGGFENKGGELMLRTCSARLRDRYSECRIAIEPGIASRYEDRARLGLGCIYPSHPLYPRLLRSMVIRSGVVAATANAVSRWLAPPDADRALGLMDRRRCDALLDIAGYAYGDKFTWYKSKIAADVASQYAGRGKPVVFMPQMFGPFENKKLADAFKRACDHANLIYAREQQSYDMVVGLIGKDERLRVSPDITIASPPPEPCEETPSKPFACIVPNERMADQGRKEWGDTYLFRLRAAIDKITSSGMYAAVVVHTNDPGDAEMAEQLRQQASEPDRIVVFRDPDPYALKAFISQSRFLVGSRFHSIVAALSTGVPAVALGWAHKYEMLAGDFAVSELQHRGADPVEHLLGLVEQLMDSKENDKFRVVLKESGDRLRGQVETMWDDIWALIDKAAA